MILDGVVQASGERFNHAYEYLSPIACLRGMRLTMIDPAKITIHYQGDEQRPLIAIDDFWSDPNALREDAASLRMGAIGAHYPGYRSPVPPRLAETMRRRIAPLLTEHFALDPAPAMSEAYYSLVTTAPADLAPIQRLPHFYGVEPRRIAVLLFLGHEE